MTEQTPQVVRSYLAQLDSALEGIDADLAREIRSGVEEELAGLDVGTASERIEKLGDPVFIAAEARDAVGAGSVRTSVPAVSGQTLSSSRGFAITAALLVAIGGFIVPIAGWLVGIVMVWMSATWHAWEKWVATLIGPAVLGALILVALLDGTSSSSGEENSVAVSPLLSWHAAIFLIPVATVIVGIWLLWRAKGRIVA